MIIKTVGPFILGETIDINRFIDIYNIIVNKTNIQSLIKKKIPSKPHILGEGTQGAAFDIGNKMVMKITKDQSEASAASIIKSLNGARGLYKVYYIFKLPSGIPNVNQDYWIIIYEKLYKSSYAKTIADKLRKFDNDFVSFIYDKYKELSYDTSEFVTSTKFWMTNIKKKLKALDGFFEAYKNEYEKYEKGIRDILSGVITLAKKKIVYDDVHEGNIMQDSNGNLVLIDIGYSRSPSSRGILTLQPDNKAK